VRRREWLEQEPFTLMLSAGFFGFFAHAGLLQALEEAGVKPRRVIGVSAGALAGGLWSTGLGARAIASELVALRRADFWDPGVPVGGLLRGRKFAAHLRRVLASTGVDRVEQCPIPFSAVAHDVLRRRALVLDRGPIDVAIRASCTVPLMFRPIWSGGRLLVDGGVSDRVGHSALDADAGRVLLHFLPSRRRLRLRAAASTPAPPNGLMLVTPGLPRVTPFALHEGAVAYERAHAHARAWLDEPL
jgi:NTE family protein